MARVPLPPLIIMYLTLIIVFRNHGGSNDGGINRFPVTPYPSKQCGKDSLPPDPINACVLDVNSVSLAIDVINVCSLNFSHFCMTPISFQYT
jgi:hypothetical protein